MIGTRKAKNNRANIFAFFLGLMEKRATKPAVDLLGIKKTAIRR